MAKKVMKEPNAMRTALVTGASKGVGRALAIALSRANWRVAITGRNVDGLHSTFVRLSDVGQAHFNFPCDISSWSDCSELCSQINKAFGNLSLLINNAFGYGEESLEAMPHDTISSFFQTSTIGIAYLTKSALPLQRKGFSTTKTKSQIINVVADWGFPMHNIMTGTPVYVAGKYALHGFGVALHRETAPQGVNVSNLYPGIIASAFDIDDDLSKVRKELNNQAIPLQDIADIVLTMTRLRSSVCRHIVFSPDNPEYNGL